MNLRATYQVTDNIQVFGMINNVTNNHYATYGTFYDTGTTGANVNATLANNANRIILMATRATDRGAADILLRRRKGNVLEHRTNGVACSKRRRRFLFFSWL